ncbi:hypothetical protein C8R45DRAFT_957117 [Mycena sanguinolenta]|nr:hypothetical protein C8R45DRAFT_957117 [Mycena sanguinolenta]
MSDLARTASPLSSSPGRNSESFERPSFPWQSRFSRRTSSSLSAAPPSNLQAAWDPSSARPSSSQTGSFTASASGSWNSTTKQHTGSTMGFNGQDDSGTRQWTFMGFEWVVRDVRKLRDFVEGVNDTTESEDGSMIGLDDFEILKLAPLVGDDKFKLEIQAPVPNGNADSKPPTLTLCITSQILDFALNYEMNATMMAAIKHDERIGARPEWVWDEHVDWVFRRESEVWDCPLPSLSALLENPRIQESDSFTICVQIHCPAGPLFPQQPSAYYVPRDLLDGLEASLDNPNTGDVRFVCLERMPPDAETPGSPASETSPATSRRPSSSTSSQSPFSLQTTARKRVIYAHSDILTRRSDYFATMLSSTFSETKLVPGDRKLYTIVVEEADFETVYWLLKYCYANWLSFKDHDDPRLAVEGIGGGWSARWLIQQQRGNEWDWTAFTKRPGDDSTVASARSATSAESTHDPNAATSTVKGKSVATEPSSISSPTRSSPQAPRAPSKVSNSASSSRQTPSTTRRPLQPPVSGSSTMSSISRTKPVPLTGSAGYSSSGHYPLSPRTQRQSTVISTPDPHPHPTPPPPPASALAIYQVAHRYGMPALAALALDHMMSTITPATSFSLLLATSVWDDLRTLVEDYVVEKWDEVSISQEFEQCCQEVSSGEWGPDGGKTLMALFRRLRSPSAMGYART